jgi:hypothetical protein
MIGGEMETAGKGGATDADVAMIQSAMNRKKSAADCTCSQRKRSIFPALPGLRMA